MIVIALTLTTLQDTLVQQESIAVIVIGSILSMFTNKMRHLRRPQALHKRPRLHIVMCDQNQLCMIVIVIHQRLHSHLQIPFHQHQYQHLIPLQNHQMLPLLYHQVLQHSFVWTRPTGRVCMVKDVIIIKTNLSQDVLCLGGKFWGRLVHQMNTAATVE